jgi:hypothetical protein
MSALTQREIFLMEKAYKAGAWYPDGMFAWLASPVASSVTVGESLISDAPLDTAVRDFLARTGQCVTNDASRYEAIAESVAAERESCAAACIVMADNECMHIRIKSLMQAAKSIRARDKK